MRKIKEQMSSSIYKILTKWQNSSSTSTELKVDEAIEMYIPTEEPQFHYQGLTFLKALQSGMLYTYFLQLLPLLPFNETEWADFFDLSPKTLQRYKKESDIAMLKPIHTEKVLQVAEVTELGLSVFDSTTAFESWLNTPNFALGSVVPKTLLKSAYGKELLIAELTRIDHGIFA